jgi:phosphatidylinositol phospholipase C, beta
MDFDNEVIDLAKYEMNDDMTKPLSHYFINSSHNTYLTGHQITGKSDAEMYREVLLLGCRCIELDCHEDDSLDEPVITHGRTLCSKILFSEAIQAINECAFKTSPYPIMLSFENFCGKRMQDKMVKYLIDILGDQLLTEPLSEYPLKSGVPLPSPEDLKYKIIIKFRKKRYQKSTNTVNNNNNSNTNTTSTLPQQQQQQQSNLQSLTNTSSSFDETLKTSTTLITETPPTPSLNDSNKSIKVNNQLGAPNAVSSATTGAGGRRYSNITFLDYQLFNRNNSQQSHSSDESDSDKDDSNLDASRSNFLTTIANTTSNSTTSSNKSQHFATIEMGSLVNYLQPTTFRTFEKSAKRNKSYEMSSFVETIAYNLHKEKSVDFVNYNKKQISRIYPKGTRISSDNFIPQMFWNVGCQLVSLNYQTLDLGMQLNLGKFEYNNRCGYLLKPEVMRRDKAFVNKAFDPFAESPFDGIVATSLKIKVISGIYINYTRNEAENKRIGQVVTVELFGLPADSLRGAKAHRVRASSANIFNTIYSDPGYTIKKIIMPELALLKFTLFDEHSKMIGQRVLPVQGLRPGYRYINLKTESNQPINMCTLFVHMKVQDYVPEGYEEFANALVNPINYILTQNHKEEMLQSLIDDYENQSTTTDASASNIDNLNSLDNENTNSSISSEYQIEQQSNLIPVSHTFHQQANTIKGAIKLIGRKDNKNCNANSLICNSASFEKDLSNNSNANTTNSELFISNSLSKDVRKSSISMASVLKVKQRFLYVNKNEGISMSANGMNDGGKRYSFSDLSPMGHLVQSNSRSTSLTYEDVEASTNKSTNGIDLEKNSKFNNDSSLFAEIDLEKLQSSKNYIALTKNLFRKIPRLQKDAEKVN